ncbi:SixA phosphatase family protein [Constantimarinum furrinae]|uniref:Phosphoglycerate mutase n=1 Tax=Constantimarinum furrinae TaxID=2562285 RepID=A0A7G8PXZ2_9FLAO|nr:phosphoglycerate mutase family protein [Constantimarinum furrinae]QNJ99208.1 Phosphoglycerate mutase [Constantimarinum furrinae]
MKNLFFIFITVLLISCNNSEKDKTENNSSTDIEHTESTTYYLIRHAEKDRSDTSNSDPELTPEGHERAKRWAKYFSDKELDLIYTTPFVRTMQTVLYTASEQNIEPKRYDPTSLYSEEFKKNTVGKNVLIVGHSNTTPAFVNAIIGDNRYPEMDDYNNSSLFIVRIKGDATSVQEVTIE